MIAAACVALLQLCPNRSGGIAALIDATAWSNCSNDLARRCGERCAGFGQREVMRRPIDELHCQVPLELGKRSR